MAESRQFDDLLRLRHRLASSVTGHAPTSLGSPEFVKDLHLTFEELQKAHEELCQQAESIQEVTRALERERQRYQELFDFAPDAYLITDVDGTIREANHAAAQLLEVDVLALI